MRVDFGVATVDEVPAIVALLRDDDYRPERELADLSSYQAAFAEIEADQGEFLIVGRDGAEVVAVVQMSVMTTMALGGTKRAQIEGLRVAREHRRTGIGRQLIRFVVEMARSKGCTLLQVTANRAREGNVPFYESLGFVSSHNGFQLEI